MSIFNVISLLGGLAMFLYGMTIMSSGLERVSGGRLEQTLEKLTGNMFKAIGLGTLVTAVIQSSSATTVIVVGLVNARILKLRQAIWIIMGANIGTTITAHILRLTELEDTGIFALQFFKPTTLAPVAAIIGILLYIFSKKVVHRDFGLFMLGFSILFSGMFAMENSMLPLRTMPQVADIFMKFSNPFLGVLVGMGVTTIIQSSSASIGILQALTVTGAISVSAAYPIIMGQNIGTCVTAVLASIGTSKNARRVALVHVTFNVVGTFLFLAGIYTIQYLIGFSFWDDPITKGGIANFHTIFNVTATLILLPFSKLLERFAKFCIRDDDNEFERDDEISMLDERFLGSPSYAITHAREAVTKMAHLSMENYNRSVELMLKMDKKKLEQQRDVENVIDKLQSKVDQYLLKLSKNELTEQDNKALSEVFQVVNEFERIGDHADNLADCAEDINNRGISFSPIAVEEFNIITAAVAEILEMAVNGYIERDMNLAANIEPLEQVINMLVNTLKIHHTERLKSGKCTIDATFPFVEALYNLERLADHCSNIGIHILSYSDAGQGLDRHEFLRQMHTSQSITYKTKFEMYDKKYFELIKSRKVGLSDKD